MGNWRESNSGMVMANLDAFDVIERNVDGLGLGRIVAIKHGHRPPTFSPEGDSCVEYDTRVLLWEGPPEALDAAWSELGAAPRLDPTRKF